jgi:hypothetical protein
MITGKIACTPARIRTHAIMNRICVTGHCATTTYISRFKDCIYTTDCLLFPRKYRSCLELKLLQCRGRPGLHHKTQNISNQDARWHSSSILPAWSTINIFSRFAHAKTYLNVFVPNCLVFLRSGIFQILCHIASVFRRSSPAILHSKFFIGTQYPARPFLLNPFLKSCVQTRNYASPSTVLV